MDRPSRLVSGSVIISTFPSVSDLVMELLMLRGSITMISKVASSTSVPSVTVIVRSKERPSSSSCGVHVTRPLSGSITMPSGA